MTVPGICPECGEPRHYHSFCTLCAKLFGVRQEDWPEVPRMAEPELAQMRIAPVLRIGQHFSAEQKELLRLRIEDLRAQGADRRQAAASLGLLPEDFDRYRRRLGLPRFAPGPAPIRWTRRRLAELGAMLAAGVPRRTLARRYNTSCDRIEIVIKNHFPHLLHSRPRSSPCASTGPISPCRNAPQISQPKDIRRQELLFSSA